MTNQISLDGDGLRLKNVSTLIHDTNVIIGCQGSELRNQHHLLKGIKS